MEPFGGERFAGEVGDVGDFARRDPLPLDEVRTDVPVGGDGGERGVASTLASAGEAGRECDREERDEVPAARTDSRVTDIGGAPSYLKRRLQRQLFANAVSNRGQSRMSVPSPFPTLALLGLLYFGYLPLLVGLHELGHAAVALAVTDEPVSVDVGGDAAREWTVGRLTVAVSLLGGWVGFYRVEGELSPTERAVCALAGPAVSVLICLVAVATLWATGAAGATEFLLVGAALAAGWQFLATIAPVRYPDWWTDAYAGRPSDGYRALRALRE